MHAGPDHGLWGLKATADPSYMYLQYWYYFGSVIFFAETIKTNEDDKTNLVLRKK